MTCEELKELYELYALGALDASDRQEVEEHLARRCPNCVAGVREARQWTSVLGYAAAPADPPARLRQRLLAAAGVRQEKEGGWSWVTHAWATVALVLLLAVLWYGYENRVIESRIEALRAELTGVRTQQAELVARNQILADALALVNLPDARQLVFGGAEPAPPRGRIWAHPSRGVLLLASGLPRAPEGKVYEMWIVPKTGAPVPAGLFHSSDRGEAMHFWPQAVDLARAGAVAVTLEAEGGVAAPTSKPVIVASF